MFKFLRDKVKGALDRISKKVEEEVPEEKTEILEEVIEKKKDADKKISVKPVGEEEIKEVKKKGLLGKIKETISTKKISPEKFDEIFEELEIALLENNVALEVIDKIRDDLKVEIVDKPISRNDFSSKISDSLKKSISDLFDAEKIDLIKKIRDKQEKPYVICFVGVNGSGKTTSIAKVANYLKDKGVGVLMVAGDTWRAASIQQLEEHGKKLNVKVIKHNYGSDPAAVAFDGIKSAKSNNIDAVLIDTAGRQQSNKDLMREMEKIIRVAKPDMNIFVGESITGNDCVVQVQEFGDFVEIGGIILTKSDVDEKGGAAISVSYVTGKPILFLGNGQEYKDIEEFDKEKLLNSLGF
ncbi:MAG: signal recognition particle-docking protein FtsY [Nanoarchaeota archaeon]|nr:signal recognition particle-docking protein FtsY [Nanoarchaeota archaeon]